MNRYERVKKIGEGSFGKALLVRRKSDRRQCVIKEINIARMSPKEKEESRKEVKVLSQLKHPNIVTYQESFEEFGNLMIVMDYCEGGDLYQKIVSQRGINFSEDQVLDYFVQICLGLKHIHDRKILHRDLKSQNIFLTKHGIIKLGDFGIARVLKNTMELARTCIGTPYYLSPEICENRPYNNKSDIWSLGCVLYELCTLKHAFESGNMKNLVLKIIRGSYPPLPNRYTPDMRNLVAQCFKRSPSDRPSVNTILRKPFIQDRIRKFLTPEVIEEEFSHTVIHKQKPGFAKPAGPAPVLGRPPSQANKRARDPAAIYGVSVAKKPVQQPKKAPVPVVKKPPDPARKNSGGNQVKNSIEKRKEVEARERRRRNVLANQEQAYQDYISKIQKQRWEKQQRDNMNRAREGGWKNLLSGDNVEKKKADIKAPQQQKEVINKQGRVMDKYQPKQEEKPAGKKAFDDDFLDKALEQKPIAGPDIPKQEQQPFDAYKAAVQGKENSAKSDQAAHRAKLVDEFWQRKREAAMNKARGNQDLANKKPYARKPVGQGFAIAGMPPFQGGMAKNQQEQEYLKQLEAIRKQNFYERLNQQNKIEPNAKPQPQQQPQPQYGKAPIKAPAYGVADPRYDPEARRKKIAALKEQADHRAILLREQLDKRRKVLQERLEQDRVSRDKEKKDRDKQIANLKELANNRPISAQGKEGGFVKAPEMVVPPVGLDTAMGQLEKVKLFRSCSEGDLPDIKKIVEQANKERKQWGAGPVSPIAALPLEMTASEMEATSADDVVLKPGQQKVDARKCWNPDGKTQIVSLLHHAELTVGSTVAGTLITTGNQGQSKSPSSPGFAAPRSPEKSGNYAFYINLEGNVRDKPASPRKSTEGGQIAAGSPRSCKETFKVSARNSKSGNFGETVIRRPLPPRPKLSDEEEEEEKLKESHDKKQGLSQVKKAWAADAKKVSEQQAKSSSPKKADQEEKLFQKGRNVSTPTKDNDELKLEEIEEEEESFHTPSSILMETRGQGLKTGHYDTDRKLLRTCSLPDLTKINKRIETLDISASTDSDNGSKKETSNESSDSMADDERDDEDEESSVSGMERGLPARDTSPNPNEVDTGDAEDEAEEEEYGNQSPDEEAEEIEDLENMLNSMRHVLDSSGGKTPTLPEDSSRKEEPSETSPREEQVRSSIFEDWDSDEGEDEERTAVENLEKTGKKVKNKENLFQRIEESRQALEEELGSDRFLKVYRYIQAMQENDDDELNVSIGPENEVMDLLGPEKEHLYQKVLYLVMADAAYFEDND